MEKNCRRITRRGGLTGRTSVDYPVRLQENEYFVLGDNRDHSLDSREYGPVTSEQIMGKVLITFRRNN